jgi:hypothetical protein
MHVHRGSGRLDLDTGPLVMVELLMGGKRGGYIAVTFVEGDVIVRPVLTFRRT